MNVVLINPYELGRQPFGLAEPAAMLTAMGCEVTCLDLSIQKLDKQPLLNAQLIGIYLPMHTATRIALEALPKIKSVAPNAHLCVFGLYAPMNAKLFRDLGVKTILGGEIEPGLQKTVQQLQNGSFVEQAESDINLAKISFVVPDRTGLPPLSKYAHLKLPNGAKKTVGFAEGTRGCKHLCRHCPVVPVYKGVFRVVPLDIVMADISNQVAAGAQHISFGDPDFLNGPTHAKKLIYCLHKEFPEITYDATIKVQHIIKHQDLLIDLKETGCLFITTAVESVDNNILEKLDKNHTNEEFAIAVQLLHDVNIAFSPTFVPFTPWTSLRGYLDLLYRILELELVESVAPIQLAIRLLIPEGSYLFNLPGFRDLVEPFDSKILGYPWQHQDPKVDQLQENIQSWVADAEQEKQPRKEIFIRILELTLQSLDENLPDLSDRKFGQSIPCLSESWYCCAEPTHQQLQSF